MAIDKKQVLIQIQTSLHQNLKKVEMHVYENSVNFSIPMKFTAEATPAPVHFTCRVNDNYVDSFCVMTKDFFDLKTEQEPNLDFYKLMNFINISNKAACSYFYVENALVCSTLTPAPKSFDPDVFSFGIYNLVETVSRYTAGFYGILNGHVTFDQLAEAYQQQQ